MKSFNILLVILVLCFACKEAEKQSKKEESKVIEQEFASFGANISADGALQGPAILKAYNEATGVDSLSRKFKAKVTDVCQAKGCWMKIELENGQEAMVRFKDYGFFVPKDIAGQEVIIDGKAFIDMMSVEDQKHYAEDGGASAEEIAQIVSPKKTFGFEAEGVLIPQ